MVGAVEGAFTLLVARPVFRCHCHESMNLRRAKYKVCDYNHNSSNAKEVQISPVVTFTGNPVNHSGSSTLL